MSVLANSCFNRVKIDGMWQTIKVSNPYDAIWGKTRGLCFYCGCELTYQRKRISRFSTRFTVDHFVPRKLGGEDTLDNLVPACYSCNQKKGSTHPSSFLGAHKYRRACQELGINCFV